MYVDDCLYTRGGKEYRRVLLREGFRANGKVMHRTVANISKCSTAEIEAIKLALKHKKDLSPLKTIEGKVVSEQGPCVGAIYVLKAIAERLHIAEALSNTNMGKKALWQVIARAIEQGSRLSAVRLAQRHAVPEMLGINKFDEDDLYSNLDWVSENQSRIEDDIFRLRYKDRSIPKLFLYDVTSSYLEGLQNELADRGYNRDKKKGKLQIVIGLLVDEDGTPVSVEVFKGNTNDTKTVLSQVKKLTNRFGVKEVTFVGDRGMIKSAQVENLKDEHFHYITAITKPQIELLIKNGAMQLDMFEDKLCDIEHNGIRYILRKNSFRAQELRNTREEKIRKVSRFLDSRNQYIAEHKKADISKQMNKVDNLIKRLGLSTYVSCNMNDGKFSLSIDDHEKEKSALLDGCYVIKTDLGKETIDSALVHSRYKDLIMVERGFRTMKTGLLETRPIYVRKESRTRGHVFVVMLAYLLIQELERLWSAIDITVEEGIEELSTINIIRIKVGECEYNQIPKPRKLGAELLKLANIELPDAILWKNNAVATKKKLQTERKRKKIK